MASPVKKTVELFFDVVSPYAWIGFEVLSRYQHKWNIDLKLKPFFLGGIMKGSDNQPPAMIPNKAAYMNHDVPRMAKHYQLPLRFPSNPAEVMFIKGTLPAMRFVTAVDMEKPECTEALCRELWLRVWSRDEDICETKSFIEAGKKAGLDDMVVQYAIKRSKTPAVKNRLKEYTEEALQHGAFGAPTIIAHVGKERHMVFGSDRFHILADILGENYQGPLNELNKAKL